MGKNGVIMPVFPNWYPFNDMVFDGHLKVDDYEGVKTRSWNWDYRGPILFYNSSRTAKLAAKAYNYKDGQVNHKVIIGVGNLVDVRKLTRNEALKMAANFNNLTVSKIKKILLEVAPDGSADPTWINGYGNYIAPFEIGFFFKNLKRFLTPVPFNWPSGPIKPIFIDPTQNPKLDLQIEFVK